MGNGIRTWRRVGENDALKIPARTVSPVAELQSGQANAVAFRLMKVVIQRSIYKLMKCAPLWHAGVCQSGASNNNEGSIRQISAEVSKDFAGQPQSGDILVMV